MTVTLHYRPSVMTKTRAAIYQWAMNAAVKAPALLRKGDTLSFLPPPAPPSELSADGDTAAIGRVRVIGVRIRGIAVEAHEVTYGDDTFVVTHKTGAVLEPISTKGSRKRG